MKYNSILIIDNDWDDIETFRQAVLNVHPGIRCTFMADATAALSDLKDGVIIPKAIFLDLSMAPLSGQEFLALVKADNKIKDIPIYILSGYSGDEIKADTIAAGAADFITKPSSFNELVDSLKAVLI